jgi:hypothetical protein
MGYGLWVMGYGLWVMGYGLEVIGIEQDIHPRRRWKTSRSKTPEEEAASSSTFDSLPFRFSLPLPPKILIARLRHLA